MIPSPPARRATARPQPAVSSSRPDPTAFWQGPFGDRYTERNAVRWEERVPFFRRVLELAPGVESVCEPGANRGHDLQALHAIDPRLRLTGVEVNHKAARLLAELPFVQAVPAAIQDYTPAGRFDLVVVCGVLIHIAPADLPLVYQCLFDWSRRYVLLNEYFHPVPVEVPYRGHAGVLFKRDFGGEFWDRFAARLRLAGYGFLWKRAEPAWDNTTWWLFEKLETGEFPPPATPIGSNKK
ncbi:MAG: pseudaminic acid biosynthesis-associated methylase [Candidatus Riflebacteria bacterium]|nr:pseudaminic acid biosynthesis-associated methylase [Candidatus Riflebacteria bacterium]